MSMMIERVILNSDCGSQLVQVPQGSRIVYVDKDASDDGPCLIIESDMCKPLVLRRILILGCGENLPSPLVKFLGVFHVFRVDTSFIRFVYEAFD